MTLEKQSASPTLIAELVGSSGRLGLRAAPGSTAALATKVRADFVVRFAGRAAGPAVAAGRLAELRLVAAAFVLAQPGVD